MPQYRYETTGENENFVFGKTFTRTDDGAPWEFSTTFSRYRQDLWFAGHPQDVLARLGIVTERSRARELADLFDGNLDGFYYAAAACAPGTGDEALKWIMGALAAHLNAEKISFDRVSEVLPADYLAAFVAALVSGGIEKVFAKDVFAALLKAKRFEVDETQEGVWEADNGYVLTAAIADSFVGGIEGDWSFMPSYNPERRISGAEAVARIAARPEFKAADSSAIDGIIADVIAANPKNAAKVKDQPKLLQFFIGQVMKAAKGKAPAPVVTEKLKVAFGI